MEHEECLNKRYEALLEKYTQLANKKNADVNYNIRQSNNGKAD